MPGYRAHIAGGLLMGALVMQGLGVICPVLKPVGVIELLITCGVLVLGALLPDIDNTSKGSYWFYSACALVILWALITQRIFLVGVVCVSVVGLLFVKHRTLTHRWWFGLVCGALLWCGGVSAWPAQQVLIDKWVLFFFLGFLSHLVLDFLF
jgi:hypothetical protein